MTHEAIPPKASDGAPSGRPARAFLLAVGIALASGVALAAWSATDGLASEPAVMLPHGPMLDHLLDEAKVSPTQRAQVRQIFDAADARLREQRIAERADRAQMARLLSQGVVDADAVEAVRSRIEKHHDLESRRATQALIDVSLVLNAQQRQAIAGRLTAAPRPFESFAHPPAASAATT
jgi:Spy/CpxP family protein refolding chaperone